MEGVEDIKVYSQMAISLLEHNDVEIWSIGKKYMNFSSKLLKELQDFRSMVITMMLDDEDDDAI